MYTARFGSRSALEEFDGEMKTYRELSELGGVRMIREERESLCFVILEFFSVRRVDFGYVGIEYIWS